MQLIKTLTENMNLLGSEAVLLDDHNTPYLPARPLFMDSLILKIMTLRASETSGNTQRHSITSQRTRIFTNTALKTSNFT
jgi:hypothetical protein